MLILKFLNFGEWFNSSNGKDNVVTKEKPLNSKTMKSTFADDGIFSERIFGSLNDLENYQCSCGNLTGHFYKDELCSVCNTRVERSKSTLERIGWIDLNDNYLINPIFFQLLSKVSPEFKKIIQKKDTIDIDGNLKCDKKTNYEGMGIDWFRENIDEVLEYFEDNIKPHNESILKLITKNKDLIFISKIPVVSTALRPATMVADSFFFDEMNNYYNFIIKINNILISKKVAEINKESFLYNMQLNLNQIMDKIFESIKGKDGTIRKNLLGTKVNFSARNLIVPMEKGYSMNDVILPYLTFLELYKLQIINLLSKLKGINLIDSKSIVENAKVKFNKEVHNIMDNLVRRNDIRILLNRNPTISIGSVLEMNVVKVKADINDYALELHNLILALLGADFDGDGARCFFETIIR